MMKDNISIHTIHLPSMIHLPSTIHLHPDEIFRKSVIPYLETNRLRPRLLAIQKARPIPYHAKLLGRALLSARDDANSVWIILSGNAEFVSVENQDDRGGYEPSYACNRHFYFKCCCCRHFSALTTTLTGILPRAAAVWTAATSTATPSTPSNAFAFAFALLLLLLRMLLHLVLVRSAKHFFYATRD
jgi:hypothetical protein